MRAEQSRAEQSRAERLSWLDVLKGIGIILVVIGHIYSNQTIFNWLYSFHMPLFFLAAGWVYKEKTVLADIKRRIQTIVIPYFSFGFLVLIYWQLMERRFRDSDMSFMDSLFGLFSGCYDNLEFNIHLWFLPCFFVTVILFNILVNLGGRRMAYLVSALMSLAFIVVPMHGLIWGIDRVFKYIGFYAVGVFIAGKSVKAVKKKVKAGIVAIVLLALSFSLSCYHLTMGIMWFVTAMIGVAAVILISQLINENRILQYFGRISLIILCIHGPVYRIVVKIVSILLNLGTDAVRENFLLAMVVVVITMAICSTAYEVVVRLSYHAHERYTVFALHNCTHYYYESQGNEHQTIPHNHFEDMEWHIRLVLEGEDRLVRNLEARESETFSYAADVNPEYNNEMEDPRINVIKKKKAEENLHFSTLKR